MHKQPMQLGYSKESVDAVDLVLVEETLCVPLKVLKECLLLILLLGFLVHLLMLGLL